MNAITGEVVSAGATIAHDKHTAAAAGHLAPPHNSGMPTVAPYEEKEDRIDEKEKGLIYGDDHAYVQDVDVEGTFPTEEEQRTLPRTSEKVRISMNIAIIFSRLHQISKQIFMIVLVEFAERFAYYGASNTFTNLIQNPLPEGSTTGAVVNDTQTPGALDLGQQASTGEAYFQSRNVHSNEI